MHYLGEVVYADQNGIATPDFGSSTIKFMKTEDQGTRGMGSEYSCSWGLCQEALFLTQMLQVFTYSLTIFHMQGQWKFRVISSNIFSYLW